MNLKHILLGTSLLLSGCSSLPNIYRDNLTASSPAYKLKLEETLADAKGCEERARFSFALGKPSDCNDFEIKKAGDVAYSRWKKNNSRNVVICINGLESHAGWFSGCANRLASDGITTYGLDRRGSGLNSRISGNRKDWVEDVDKIVEIAKKENPNSPISLVSLCFGARIATEYAIENPEKVNSLVYISPGFKLKVRLNFGDYLIIAADALPFVGTNTKSPVSDDRMFTTNPEFLEYLREDKFRTRKPDSKTFFEGDVLLKSVLKNIKDVKPRALFLLSERDRVVDVDKTIKLASAFNGAQIKKYDADHTIFFSDDLTTQIFIRDIENFISNGGKK